MPPAAIQVVEVVWREVTAYAPDALKDPRLCRVPAPPAIPESLAALRLDDGETCSLAYALGLGAADILILCDDVRARKACRGLSLGVVGSIGLIVEARREGRASAAVARRALEDLPTRGRLHVSPSLVQRAVESLG